MKVSGYGISILRPPVTCLKKRRIACGLKNTNEIYKIVYIGDDCDDA
jgi:hypothetical protein